jgi:hypothetical protein
MFDTVFVNCHILFTMYNVFQFFFLLPEWRNKVEYILMHANINKTRKGTSLLQNASFEPSYLCDARFDRYMIPRKYTKNKISKEKVTKSYI